MQKFMGLAALAALIAVPVAVAGAQAPAGQRDVTQRRVCTVETKTGSRLGGRTRCRTAEEAEQEQIEARRTVDRIQAFKPTICAPQPGC